MEERETAAYIERELRVSATTKYEPASERPACSRRCTAAKWAVTLLRADMDGLPVEELNDASYRSTRKGVMHACGHDAHMAILLSEARELVARKAEVPGTLVFCFQPGEEGHWEIRR